MKNLAPLVVIGLLFSGCSDTETNTDTDIFKTQVESIDKAEEVEQQILDAAARQRQALEENVNP